MQTYASPLATRLAARRSSAPLAPDALARRDPQSGPTTRAPFVPEWRRRALDHIAAIDAQRRANPTARPTQIKPPK